jgi:hypothetical protein
MRQAGIAGLLSALLALAAAGCGSKNEESEAPPSAEAKAACNGKPLSSTPKLPPSWPQIESDKLTYTVQKTEGPTVVVDGYFKGDVEEAHDEWKKELQAAGYTILFDELEEHDSEVSWKGEGRSGQVALREECGASDKTYVHITNRPA